MTVEAASVVSFNEDRIAVSSCSDGSFKRYATAIAHRLGDASPVLFTIEKGHYTGVSPGVWMVGAITRSQGTQTVEGILGGTSVGDGAIKVGQVVVLPPRSRFEVALRTDIDVDAVLIAPRRFEAIKPSADATTKPRNMAGLGHSTLLGNLIQRLIREEDEQGAQAARYRDSLIDTIVMEVIQLYAGVRASPIGPDRGLTAAQLAIIDRIIERDATSVSASQLSEAVGMSAGKFAEALRRATQKTVYQYVLCCRLEAAQRLISTSELTLPEVAFRYGFSSQSHMTDAFRRKLGITPGQIRQMASQPHRSLQQQAQGGMSEHTLVHEPCGCRRKAGGLA